MLEEDVEATNPRPNTISCLAEELLEILQPHEIVVQGFWDLRWGC